MSANLPYPKTVEAFKVWDIDPSTVSVYGLGQAGYHVFVMLDGKKQLDEETGNFIQEFVAWEPGQENIFEIFKSEGGMYV